jgi:hypothetical protein
LEGLVYSARNAVYFVAEKSVTVNSGCGWLVPSFARASAFKLPNIRYRGADKSLAQPTSRCVLFDGENISFDACLVTYINSTNIPPIMIINRIYETQNLLSL